MNAELATHKPALKSGIRPVLKASRVISTGFGRVDAAVVLHRVLATPGGHRLQLTVRRHSIEPQSSAWVERWDGTKWQEMFRLDWTRMQSTQHPAASYYAPGTPDAGAYEWDLTYLFQVALDIMDI